MNLVGHKISGLKWGIRFTATIRHVEPNWEHDSRNAVNVYFDGGCLLGLNLTTGTHYRASRICPAPEFSDIRITNAFGLDSIVE